MLQTPAGLGADRVRIDVDKGTAPEQWRPVVGWEGLYEVSSEGRVRSIDRVVMSATGPRRYRGRPLALSTRSKCGHLKVGIERPGGPPAQCSVHHLVLAAFVGPRPPDTEGCHNDGDPTNNRVSNLRWDTTSANQLDRVRHGKHYEANKRTCDRGHLLVAPNLGAAYAKRGWRRCKACNRAVVVKNQRKRVGLDTDVQALSDWQYSRIMSGTG